MEFDLVIRAHCRYSKSFPRKLGSSVMSGIISNGGTSILSSKKPEFSKKDCSEISGSKYSGNQICRLRKFKYVGRYFELCSSKEKKQNVSHVP